MKKPYFLIFIVVIFLAMLKVFLTAKLATSGTDLVLIEGQTQAKLEENFILRETIVSFGSLSRISSEAGRLGFAKTEKIVSIPLEVPIALKQR